VVVRRTVADCPELPEHIKAAVLALLATVKPEGAADA